MKYVQHLVKENEAYNKKEEKPKLRNINYIDAEKKELRLSGHVSAEVSKNPCRWLYFFVVCYFKVIM